ncbi:hypothetical protein ACH49A_26655 [Micromonospora sediminicola]|uniref:ATP dependent DNA ligase n=1 Tax=Micromonospora sediminicola TaxID=946078 RepID=UPI0037A9D1B3
MWPAPHRRSGWWKFKIRNTVEAIIGGVVGTRDAPSALLLGRRDVRGQLRYIGNSAALTAPQRHELAGLITPIAQDARHHWPQPLPAAWLGQFDRSEPLAYLAVTPSVVAEIIVDQAYEHGRYRHPVRYLRLRADLAPADVELWRPA